MKTILFSFALVLGLSACNKDAFHVDPAGVEQRLSQDKVEDTWIIDSDYFEFVEGENTDLPIDSPPCPYPDLSKDAVEIIRDRLQYKSNQNCVAILEEFLFCHHSQPQIIRVVVMPTEECEW